MTKEERLLRQEQRARAKAIEAAAREAGRGPLDLPYLLLVLTLVGVGLIMLFSASFPSAYYEEGNPAHYLIRQGIFAILGITAMFIVGKINYERYRAVAKMLLIFSIILLVLVLIPGIGTGRLTHGAQRWIRLGPIQFQPSEITKVGIMLYFADSNSKKKDKMATLRYGFTKALLDDGTITELGMGRCFAGFGLLDDQTGTVFAPQQGAGNWPWSVPYLGYSSYAVVVRPQAEADKKYSDAPSPTREDPCQQVRPLTSYTLDDGRTCRLGFAEVGSWDFGETTVGQGNANGKTWALFINKSTMHGVLQIKVDAGYDDLVLYYNAQGFGENDVFSYDVWAGDGEDGPLYLDELGYFKGMQGMRFYRLDELVSLFSEGS